MTDKSEIWNEVKEADPDTTLGMKWTLNSADEMKEARQNHLKAMREDPSNMANWFPRLLESGVKVPKTIMLDLPYDTLGDFLDCKENSATANFIDKMK